MLEELEIINGTMSLPFNKLVNNYTVNVDSSISTLIMNLKAEDGYKIDIVNNNLLNDYNIVYINISKDNIINTYTLEVYKETIDTVISIDDSNTKVEVESNNNYYLRYGVIIICIILIILLKHIIFLKKDK